MLVCSFFSTIAHETAGAARIRHSLRPLDLEGGRNCKPRAQCVARMRNYFRVILTGRSAEDPCRHAETIDRFLSYSPTTLTSISPIPPPPPPSSYTFPLPSPLPLLLPLPPPLLCLPPPPPSPRLSPPPLLLPPTLPPLLASETSCVACPHYSEYPPRSTLPKVSNITINYPPKLPEKPPVARPTTTKTVNRPASLFSAPAALRRRPQSSGEDPCRTVSLI